MTYHVAKIDNELLGRLVVLHQTIVIHDNTSRIAKRIKNDYKKDFLFHQKKIFFSLPNSRDCALVALDQRVGLSFARNWSQIEQQWQDTLQFQKNPRQH